MKIIQNIKIIFLIIFSGFICNGIAKKAYTMSENENKKFKFDYHGIIEEQIIHYSLEDHSLLNPETRIAELSTWRNKFAVNLTCSLDYETWIMFYTKTRPTLSVDEQKSKMKNFLDEAYIDWKPIKNLFLTIGKENFIEGTGLSYNPSDFLGEDKEVDHTKREEDRRQDREGTYIVRLETIFDAMTFSALIAPKIKDEQPEDPRTILQVSYLGDGYDASMSYFYQSTSRFGFNISGVTDMFEFHSEAALRLGSDRKYIRKVSPDDYKIYDPSDDHKLFARALIGGHYTFSDRTNILLEYFYNEDGYSENEWDNFLDFVKYNNAQYISSLSSESAANLGIANSMMTYRYLRRNYFSFRISNPEIFDYFDCALTALLNSDDKSFAIMSSIEYRRIDNVTIDIGANFYLGDSDSEFGMLHQNKEVWMNIKYFF